MASKKVPAGSVRLVNTNVMAELSGYAPKTIRMKAREKAIPAMKFGRTLRFNPEAVIEALRSLK